MFADLWEGDNSGVDADGGNAGVGPPLAPAPFPHQGRGRRLGYRRSENEKLKCSRAAAAKKVAREKGYVDQLSKAVRPDFGAHCARVAFGEECGTASRMMFVDGVATTGLDSRQTEADRPMAAKLERALVSHVKAQAIAIR